MNPLKHWRRIAMAIIMSTICINLAGADPTDFVLLIYVPLIIMVKPTILLGLQLQLAARIAAFGVVSFYALSCYMGLIPSYAVNAVIGFALSVALYDYCVEDESNGRLDTPFIYGFSVLTAVYLVLGVRGYSLGSLFFDIFRDGRFLGTEGDPNFTGLAASLVIFMLVDRIVKGSDDLKALARSVPLLLINIAALLFTGSRAAWAACGGGLLIYLLATPRVVNPRLLIGLLVVVTGVLSISAYSPTDSEHSQSAAERVRSIFVQDDSAEQERFKFVYTATSLAVGEQHLLGVGPGMTAQYTGLVNGDGEPIGSHCAYVQIFTENGLICLLIVLAILTVSWIRLWGLSRRNCALNGIPCQVLLAGLTTTAIFGFGHDMLEWKIAWLMPSLAILAAFGKYPPQAIKSGKA